MKRGFAAICAFATVACASALLQAQARLAVETFDRAWTIVRDTHFDRAMNGVDWNAVRTELRPRAESAKDVNELRDVLRDMLGIVRMIVRHRVVLNADGCVGIAHGAYTR